MKLILKIVLTYSIILAMLQLGCGGAGVESTADAATTPQAVDLSPSVVATGQSGILLTVNGASFSQHSAILLNGTPTPTTYVSNSQVSASVPTNDISQPNTIVVTVKNMRSGRISNPLSLTVATPLQLTTAVLPAGQVGSSYSTPLAVTGGVPPYRWSLASGVLPAGLAMNSQTGAITGTPSDAGMCAFVAWVTDSASSSAQASLGINIAAAQTSSSTSYYGSGLGADGLANTTVGPSANKVSYRFRAKNSGALQQARIYLIPDHAGYAGGTGGTIAVTLNTDDGTPAHNPSSTVLATYMMSNVLSLPSPDRYFYVLQFSTPPTLTAGQLYHMVFTNVDPSPEVNFLSVDTLYEIAPTTPVQPTRSDVDAAVLLSENGSAWVPRNGFTPVYELDMANGASEGIGYMEGWVGAPEPISGTNAVRETFTVSGSQVQVTSASVRLARVNGNDPLVVRLENADGSLIEQGNIPASSVPLSSSSSPLDAWTTYAFSTTYTLVPGQTYHLDFEATSTSTYQIFPIRKGSAYGFQNTTYFPDGYAEFEQSGSWNGWTQWGVTDRTDGDLQFYFAVVP